MGFLSGIFGGGGGGGGGGGTTATQNTSTVSGQGTNAQGDKNSIGNTTTNVKTSNNVKTSSVKDSNNKINVANGGSVNYVTNTTGVSGADLATFGNQLVESAKGSGGGGGAVQIGNPVSPAVASTTSTASIFKWGIVAAIAAAAALFFLFKKKSA